MHKTPGPKVRVVATNSMAIRAMVVVMIIVMGRPMVWHMPWMPMSSRGTRFISLKGINQGLLVIISIGLMRLGQKIELRN